MKKPIDKRRKVCYNRGTKGKDRRAERLQRGTVMKRYGIKEALKEINNGAEIVYYDFFTPHAGYKLTKDCDIIGYLTASTAEKLLASVGYRVREYYSFTVYEIIK